MTEYIRLDDIIISDEQREIDPQQAARIQAKYHNHGYNTSYPITLDENNILVDGGHRLTAANAEGLESLPFVLKPKGVSRIQHAIRCNEDGTDTRAYDVFDYAELCWNLGNQEAQKELGWAAETITRYKNIKERLHPLAWELTRNQGLGNGHSDALVNSELTKVNWSERHFRDLLKHLSPPVARFPRSVMRGQLAVINAAIEREAKPDKKVTAKWIGGEARRHAWHIQLAEYMRANLTDEAPLSDWRQLLKNIKSNVFGDKPDDKNLKRFQMAVSAINENILGVQLLQGDCFQLIPQLDDDSISLVATDPPYNVTDHEWDKIGDDSKYIDFIRRWLQAIKPKLKEDYHLFISISPHYQADIEQLLKAEGWPLKSRIIWSHRNLSKGRDVAGKFITMWEMIFHCGTHSLNWPPEWNDERFEVQEWAAPQSNFENDKKLHETQKPAGLFELFVKVGSKPGDTIIDTFAGSGTTGEAAKALGQRKCILIEAADDHCQTIESRLNIKRKELL